MPSMNALDDHAVFFLDLVMPRGTQIIGSDKSPDPGLASALVGGKHFVTPGSHRLASSHLLLPAAEDPRLVVPLASKTMSLSGLSMWRPSSKAGRAVHRAAQVAVKSGLLRHLPGPRLRLLLPKTTATQPSVLQSLSEAQLGHSPHAWAAAAGSRGPFQKVAIQLFDAQGEVLAHVKAGRRGLPGARIDHEAKALAAIAACRFSSMRLPQRLGHGSCDDWHALFFEHVDSDSDAAVETEDILAFSIELHRQTVTTQPLRDGVFWQQLRARLSGVATAGLQQLFGHLDSRLTKTPQALGWAHHDLAAYNIIPKHGGCIVVDWEMACPGSPPASDLIHWLVYLPMLLGQRTPEQIVEGLLDGGASAHLRTLQSALGNDGKSLKLPILLYTLDRLSRLYEEQAAGVDEARTRQIERLERVADGVTASAE
jgi:hypothetical protein